MVEDKFAHELEMQKFWEENRIYEKVKQKNSKGENFNFIEGPPYPTGDAHLGHLRNWAIKDSTLRFRRFCGYNVYSRDGYDVHGLPVENKVQAKLNLKTVDDLKNFGVDNFLKECKDYVAKIIGDMKGVRARYGFWLDDGYQTSHPEYVSHSWRFFKAASEKGLLYKDYKTVAWCPNDETTLSDYEIKDTYKTLSDPSVYVKFPVKEDYRTTDYEESFLIWTTTPWTLQSNMAIAMNPKHNYSKVLFNINGKEEVLIIAESLIEEVESKLSKSIDIKFIKVIETKPGIEFEGVKYNHIYIDETPSQQKFITEDHMHLHSIVMADYVSLGETEDIFDKLDKKGYKHKGVQETGDGGLENGDGRSETLGKRAEEKGKSEGTGLVHIAPGHGFDDYEVGKRYNLPIFCPVDSKGIFNEGKYVGKYFKDVDPIAVDYLYEKGYLLHSEMKSHRYPCCWRCKTPIVYRAADQWWIKRSELIEGIKKENSNVRWNPESARSVFENLMDRAGDWAISRQRYWGIPLPIWEDDKGNFEVIGSKEELEEKTGKKFSDLHIDDLKDVTIKSKDGSEMRRVPFIADVWFDSGCASFASHYGEGLSFEQIIEKYYPISWITEGEDQIRGWFSSLFNVGYMVTQKAPYKNVLFYRYVMDKNGVKMSKSLGNGIEGREAIENWGSDGVRYYLLTKRAPEDQINFDPDEFSNVSGFFNTFDNVCNFMNSFLEELEFSKNETLVLEKLGVEDKWIYLKLNKLVRDFARNIEDNMHMNAFKDVEDFIVRDLSKTYLKVVKERVDDKDYDLGIMFNYILKRILVLISCATPFRAEFVYQKMKISSKKESVFLESYPVHDEFSINKFEKEGIESNFDLALDIIAATLNAREKVKIGVRWPLSQIDIASSEDLSGKLKVFEPLIRKLANISKINYDIGDADISYIIKPNFATLKADFENMSDAIKAINMSKHYIANDVKSGLSFGEYEGVKLDLTRHVIKEIELNGELASSEFGDGLVILHTHQDEILLEEGYLREMIRRIQQMRKDLGLSKNDVISLSFEGSDDYYMELANNCEELIKKRVGAQDVLMHKLEDKTEQFKIKDHLLVVSMKRE